MSTTHLVLIPSYNSGRLLWPTVQAARAAWSPVWVVIDGSTDGSEQGIRGAADDDEGLSVLLRPSRGGKGSAVRFGLERARAAGYTHALVMDADGQHPAELIAAFMQRSASHPAAMIVGVPVFGRDAPAVRVHGRKLSNWLAAIETGGRVADSLYGFRIYPIAPLLEIWPDAGGMTGYAFDLQAAVRLCWHGVAAINLPAPVRYPARAEGGVSHYRYGRDNLAVAAAHARLLVARLSRSVRRTPPTE